MENQNEEHKETNLPDFNEEANPTVADENAGIIEGSDADREAENEPTGTVDYVRDAAGNPSKALHSHTDAMEKDDTGEYNEDKMDEEERNLS